MQRPLIIISLLLLTQACSMAPVSPVPVEDRSKTATTEEAEIPMVIPGSETVADEQRTSRANITPVPATAVIALLDDAEQQELQGNHATAVASLERAIRLDPKNAHVWHRLASIRLQQGNWQQALTLARKSNSLAAGGYALQIENWRIILQVKQKVRDIDGVKHAGEMIEQLKLRVKSSDHRR